MKYFFCKRFLAFLFLLLLNSSIQAQIAPYCVFDVSTTVEPITLVNFAGINNSSANTTSANPSATESESYTALSGTVITGSSYTITVKGNTAGNFTCHFRVFFDWNGDNDFVDAGEAFYIGTVANSTGLDAVQTSTSILIPATTAGTKRMRVVKNYAADPALPCGPYNYGQAEDYSLVVSVPCTASTAPSSISGPTVVGTGTTNAYSVVGGSLGTGAVWNWYTGSCGGTLVYTGATYSPIVSGSTTYYVRAQGTCGTTSCVSINVTTQSACDVIYVDAVNGNDTYGGLSGSPVKTLTKALTLVSGTRNHIKMTNGTYAETSVLTLQSNVIVEGRYTNSSGVWSKSSSTASSTQINCSGTETISTDVEHVMGFKSNALSGWKLIDLNVTTAAATGQATGGNGKSNYCIWISGSSNYEISRCNIISGNATNGTNGANGANGSNGAQGNTGGTGGCGLGNSSGGGGGNGGGGGAGGSGSGSGGAGTAGTAGGFGGGGGDDNGTTTSNTSVNQSAGNWNGRKGSATACAASGDGGNRSSDNSCGNNAGQGGTGANCSTVGSAGTAGTVVPATYNSGYFVPSYGNHGAGGAGGTGGGGGGGGGGDDDNTDVAGDGGSGGGGGGGGGQGGSGSRGGGATFGIFTNNSGAGTITNLTISTGSAGTGGTGGNGGTGGTGGALRGPSNCGCGDGNRGGQGGSGSNGGAGGVGGNANAGSRFAIAQQGGTAPTLVSISPAITINSSTSGGAVTNAPIVSLNQIPNKICQNSVLNVSTTVASWTLPSNWSFVKYNNTAATSEYTAASTTADITTTNTTGFYDVTANGVVFNSYLNVRTARTLPVITVNPSPVCSGNTVNLSATSWGTETEYKWEIFDATNAPNKGLTTNLVSSYTTANPTTGVLLSGAGVAKTYLVRYQVKEECCGWSIPVFATITVNPSLTANVSISASPAGAICSGTSVTFTATPTNGGTTPVYQWKLNGGNVGTGLTTYSNSTLNNSDVVTCVMTSNATPCLTGSPAASNTITMTVNSNPAAPQALSNISAGPVATVNGTALLPDANITANSCWTGCVGGNHEAWRGRLFNQGAVVGAWASGNNNLNNTEYLQFDLNGVQTVKGVSTQGRGDCCPQAVSTYTVQYSQNGSSWSTVPGVFTGNVDQNTVVTNTFTPVLARYVRIYPQSFGGGHMSMRADVLVIPCSGGTVSMSSELTANSTNVRWYDVASAGTPLSSDQYYTTPSLLTDKIYYAECYNSTSGCASATRTAITAQVASATNVIAGSATSTCIVNGNNWVHFLDNTGKLIVSINPGSNNLGSVTAESFDQGSPVLTQACNTGSNGEWTTAVLGRSWKITPQFNLSAQIRFPLEESKLSSLYTSAVGTNLNPRDNISSATAHGDLKMSRYSGANQNGNWADNCASGGTLLYNPVAATGGFVTTGNGFPATIATTKYVQFSTPGFSEFWLHGDSNGSPLPVTLTTFSATCNNQNKVNVIWSTASEQNSQKFIVEKSRDMNQWIFVAELQAAGNSTMELDYTTVDNDPFGGISYYRLVQVDNDGTEKAYTPISVSCGDQGNSMIVFPNPSKGNFTVEITSIESLKNAEVQLMDLTGKVISSRKFDLVEGKTHILFDELNLEMGTYIVWLASGNEFKPVKVVVN